MTKKEMREKKLEELIKHRDELETNVRDTYFDMRLGKVANLRKPRLLRKELALVNTIIREKKMEETRSVEKKDTKLSSKEHVAKNET